LFVLLDIWLIIVSYVICISYIIWNFVFLTPKGRRPFFGPFLKFGQAIVNAIFVQKIWIFWWTCGLVLASRCTNFYKIPIFNLGAMPQNQNYFEVRAARAAKKLFIFKLFWVGIFFHEFLTKLLILLSTWKSSKTHEFYYRNVERLAKSSQKFVVDLSTFL
jgi:hypothetical protein